METQEGAVGKLRVLLFCVVHAVDPADGEAVVYALLLSGGGVRTEVPQTAGGSVQ